MSYRALLTGASGFIGSHYLTALLQLTDWDVVALGSFCHNGTTDRLTTVIDAHPLGCDRVTVVTHDLRAPLSPAQRRTVGDVDHVFHVASRCSVDQSIAAPRDFVANNVAVTLTTLELARELRPRRFLHQSTDEVYGSGHPPEAVTDHRPSSPYSASKAAQEDICYAYARTFGVPVTIVTSANMFGERQSQLAFIPRIVRAVLRDEVLPVHVDATGQPGRRFYTYVGDVTARVVTVARDDDTKSPDRLALPGMFHVDNLELARQVARHLGSDLRYELVPGTTQRPGYDPLYHRLTSVDDRSVTGDRQHDSYDHVRLFDDRLHRTVTWFAEHPAWLEVT